jgi:hypothetical protein
MLRKPSEDRKTTACPYSNHVGQELLRGKRWRDRGLSPKAAKRRLFRLKRSKTNFPITFSSEESLLKTLTSLSLRSD